MIKNKRNKNNKKIQANSMYTLENAKALHLIRSVFYNQNHKIRHVCKMHPCWLNFKPRPS